MKHLTGLSIFMMIFLIFACHKDDGHSHGENMNQSYMDAADCNGLSPTFMVDIKSIIDNNCATSGCHDATTASHGVQLDTYANVVDNFNHHNFLCTIHHGADCTHMPFNGNQLSASDIELITCWAKGGLVE